MGLLAVFEHKLTLERKDVEMLPTIVCAALMLLLLMFSDSAMSAARTAAQCFATGVMPALLPMMVLGKFLPDDTKHEHSSIGLWLRTGLYAFAAGSPAAAQRTADLRGLMPKRSWESMLCLTGVMSPMFLTGTLGGWLGSARDGRILLGLHWLGAAITAGLWHMLPARHNSWASLPAPTPAQRFTLPEAIARSVQPLLCVCGAMMVFSAAAGLMKSLLAAMFPLWTAQHADWLAVLWAVMEVGGGSSAVIAAWPKPHALVSALCGLGGLSIWLQNLLFLENSIRPAKLLGMRALHGAVCYALVRILNPF